MTAETDISRFREASDWNYEFALKEIRNGQKRSHWIWFIFPQMRGLGFSHNSQFYGIADLKEAELYLSDPILGPHLREITTVLLEHNDKSAVEIFGRIDAIKVQSSMTLFDLVSPNDIFDQVLEKYYNGKRCIQTISLINNIQQEPAQ
ncbi:MAG: DUF1810 domain-containing protein [Alistipes sp.]|nr:DUF1810 domain-containing protein [Alistipes sp.]